MTPFLSLITAFFTAFVFASCSSVGLGPSGAGECAGTTIESSNLALIRRTTVAVFAEKGFRLNGPSKVGLLRFAKTGSRSAQITRGSNLNDNPVIIRPEVEVNPLGTTIQLISKV